MEISSLQNTLRKFNKDRKWDSFNASLVFTHLIEEIGEIGNHILFSEGYKKEGLGHLNKSKDINREFAQVFFLLIQLANKYSIDLENSIKDELKIMEERFDKDKWNEYMKKQNQ
ncbi:MAG: hypothetical protein ACTSUV_04700 [Candidatus Ranarchaeia archaeon]